MKHNSVAADIPIIAVMKALGIQSDQEIAALVCGDDLALLDLLTASFEESAKLDISSQGQALEFIGSKVKGSGIDPEKKN